MQGLLLAAIVVQAAAWSLRFALPPRAALYVQLAASVISVVVLAVAYLGRVRDYRRLKARSLQRREALLRELDEFSKS